MVFLNCNPSYFVYSTVTIRSYLQNRNVTNNDCSALIVQSLFICTHLSFMEILFYFFLLAFSQSCLSYGSLSAQHLWCAMNLMAEIVFLSTFVISVCIFRELMSVELKGNLLIFNLQCMCGIKPSNPIILSCLF